MEHVSHEQLATLLSMDRRTVKARLLKAGVAPISKRGRQAKYASDVALAAILAPDRGSPDDLARERARLAAEQADRVAMQNAEARGEYISRMVVMATWANLISSFRSRMLAMPRKLAPLLANSATPVQCAQLVEDEVYHALEEVSGTGLPPESEPEAA